MPHNPADVNKQLLALADEFGVKAVVTPDCHHAHTGQKEIQELKLILNTYSNKVLKDATYEKSKKFDNLVEKLEYLYGQRDISFTEFDIHLLSDSEMRAAMESQGISREDMYESTQKLQIRLRRYNIKDGTWTFFPFNIKDPRGAKASRY
jgi:hypothetical protein